MKFLILGAGPCGLGAAYHLNKLGYTNWHLFERCSHVGGLSASFHDDKGFTWDIGGHVLFSHYDYFDCVLKDVLGEAFYEHQRESWVRILQTWVPYPFQNNVRYLPAEVLQECIEGLRFLSGSPKAATNFRDWMDAVFGKGIVKYFMEPYNVKVWGTPLDTMSKDWIAERVSMVDLARIERNIKEQRDDLSWGPNNTFRFPAFGGTGAIFDAIARDLQSRLHLHHEMVAVNLEEKQVTFANGRVEPYDILINTTPLDQMVHKCIFVPERLRSAANDLIHNSGLIVGLGFNGERRDSKCWMYFPEANTPFYRVTNFHNYSPHNVPNSNPSNFFSLMCETTYSSFKQEHKETIIEATIQGLINAGMIEANDRERIVSSYLIDIAYSYPVPTVGRDDALCVINQFLESQGIYSRGRFGAWKYEVGNMDHSFMQGVEVVEHILNGSEEQTLHG